MKFLHTADWHIGASRFIPNFLERQEAMIDSIFDLALSKNIEVVVVAGDIFDTSNPSIEEQELFQRKLLQYDAAGFHVLVIPGNHDLVDATGRTALRPYASLSASGRYLYSVVTEHTVFVPIGDVVFCLLCHRRRKFSSDARSVVGSYCDSSIDVGKKLIVVAHETIVGSLSDVKLPDGSNHVIDKGEDAPDDKLPVTYWALGDIHKYQKVAPRAYYSGSPVQTKFGDEWPKGVLLVDTDFPENPEFVSISSNQLVKAGVHEAVPFGAWVKWTKARPEDLATLGRADNVVKVEFDSDDHSALALNPSLSLREKILEGVKQLGATEPELAVATDVVGSLLRLVDS